MNAFLRRVAWWWHRRRKEAELREELEFHLAEELEERRAGGEPEGPARQAARRDLGNVTLLREDTRMLWTWTPLEQLGQDVRYAVRTMARDRAFTALVALSLALGIGANTAIYSFMDAILWRALPVSDPAALVALHWRARPYHNDSRATGGNEFVLRSINGSLERDSGSVTGAIFPYPAFERLREVAEPVLSSLFAYHPAGTLNVSIDGAAEIAVGEYVSGDFFGGLGVPPAAGRLITAADDRPGADPVAVVSMGYSQRRFGGPERAVGRAILVDNVPFTVIGVAPAEFFGVDPGDVPHVYLPLRARFVFGPATGEPAFHDVNYYWLGMMGRLRPGVERSQAEAVLRAPFAVWVAGTATNDRERANLPVLTLQAGAGGLDSLRRQYSKPLYVLMAMVGLILIVACANTANLLLARATARRREMAVRLSIGASRSRVVRQLLTESVLLASLGGALGILFALAGIGLLTGLLANGREGFTLHAELNGHVLGVTLGLSVLCGILFGLAPAIQTTRPALMPTLRDVRGGDRRRRGRGGLPSLGPTRALVVAQVAISLLLLVGAGLFVRTLSNLQSVPLGYDRDRVLLFDVNAPQAGVARDRVVAFYAGLRTRLLDVPGVRDVTLSHASLVRAGRSHPITVDGAPTPDTRILMTGPGFFTTMRIPLRRGREIEDRDRAGSVPVAVVSDAFVGRFLGDRDPLGTRLTIGGSLRMEVEIVGVAATARYGGLKREIPPVVYVAYAQAPAQNQGAMTYALRTDGDPAAYAGIVRDLVHRSAAQVPVTNLRTLTDDIDRTINQEMVFARLCTAFAVLALAIACVGLYGTMSYAVARRTHELGIRLALGARRGRLVWMVQREVVVLALLGLAISLPIALESAALVDSLLFAVRPDDPRTFVIASAVLLGAALLAGYLPSRRASRVDPLVALRHE